MVDDSQYETFVQEAVRMLASDCIREIETIARQDDVTARRAALQRIREAVEAALDDEDGDTD